MFKEIYKNIYLVEIPLTGNPLKYLNCYIIKTENKNLIIDTGFNNDECKEVLQKAIKDLEIDLQKTSLLLTHLHSDHTGLANYFDNKNVKIYMGEKDAILLNDSVDIGGEFWQNSLKAAKIQGLHEDNLNIEDHPGYKNRPDKKIRFIPLNSGDFIKIGNFNFEVLDLEGHTPGIIGLYDKKHKIMFCGDHILAKITPNITFWGYEYNDMLGKYLNNLDKVHNMEINHLFSAHRYLVEDHRKRIAEIKEHHEKRLSEIKNVLKFHGKSTVRTVTKNIHWDIKSKNWDEFPDPQKWFAAGEAQAHLERLKALGEVNSEIRDGLVYYYLV